MSERGRAEALEQARVGTEAPPAPAAAPAADDLHRPRLRTVLTALCVTEITSWGILYYAFPVLASTIKDDTGWSIPASTAAFSLALVVAGIVGIPVGRLLDRRGPHLLMTAGSVVGVGAVLMVAWAPNLAWFTAAWLVAGVAMSAVLYQPAFAALTRWYGPGHLGALTTVTLVAGLASTVFAPLTDLLATHMSWRATYVVLAGVLAAVTIPLHAIVLRRPWPPAPPPAAHADVPTDTRAIIRSRPFVVLVVAMTVGSFAMYAVVINIVPLLEERGSSTTVGAWALGLGGAGQVLGRFGYSRFARASGVRARTVGVLAATAACTALLAFVPGPVWLLVVIAVVAGTWRGMATLLNATAITERWGATSYGTLSGILSAPAMAASALAPWAGAALAGPLGGYAHMFALLAALGLAAAALATGSVPTVRVSRIRRASR
ncbi:MFS transporter [Yinghuangia seranimata]|uniref:MFS transporter n=1 Tax=Yinghuangia seranimata TaxID=408067 RepID=UPI00248B8FC8|nr:MFS transporter [Yinghuangia seranimata]MDI2131280.1 MFS transporter [Yinghuangia seranimata]